MLRKEFTTWPYPTNETAYSTNTCISPLGSHIDKSLLLGYEPATSHRSAEFSPTAVDIYDMCQAPLQFRPQFISYSRL
ncbi:hypothetical protein AB6A40_002646 [Gnathostoma spinigerum]|uniref:Uncharacterized protein n=1 Tax=Gnathostoma spinigerum TaxID=75299 RepID=A0ABD6EHA2_9BILA